MIRFYFILSLYLVTCMAFAKPASKPLPYSLVNGTHYFRPFLMDQMKQFLFADESHDFRTFDTTISAGYSGITWRCRISMPTNYFTANHPDTASRPMIITVPGQGEMGTSYSTLDNWGPFYETARGWDGSVTLGDGFKRFPILITAISSNTFMNGKEYGDLQARLYYWLHPRETHAAGLSQGAFAISSAMLIDSIAAKHKSFACFHGRSNEYTASITPAETEWGKMAKKYDIRFFGLEGNAADNFREVWRVSNRVHDSIANNAYFSYTSVASGGHGGWDTIYSRFQTNWRSVTPFGTYNTASQGANGIDRMGTYFQPSNIYQWMLRQGDTTLVGQSDPEYIVKPAMSEYKIGYLTNTGKVYSFTNNQMQQYGPTDTTMVDVATGFNTIAMLDEFGYVHLTTAGVFTPTTTRVSIDTSGAAFNNNIAVFGCGAVGGGNIRPTFCTIKSDSTVWYWGDNHYNFFGGGRPIKPIQLSPGGMKFKKLAMNYYKIVGLTTAGDVYEWLLNGSTTPTQKTLPRPAIDIAVTYFDAAVAIVPKATGSQAMGYPYWWGNAFNMWGGVSGTSTPTERWSLTVPIKKIGAGYHTTHYIDSLSNMYGIGENVMGEIGNGVQYVDKYTYPTPWDWSFTTGENMISTPVEIGAGTNWKNVWGDNTLSFYKVAQDENDSLYFWGRDKALVSGRGYLVMQEESYPNVIDVITPTQIHPTAAIYQQYNFTAGSANAGSDQSTSSTTITLSGSGTATSIVANGTVNNGQSNISPSITQYNWTKVSGTGGTIVSPANATTDVSGLSVGSYQFRLVVTMTDGSTVTDLVNVTITAATVQPGVKMRRGGRFRVQ